MLNYDECIPFSGSWKTTGAAHVCRGTHSSLSSAGPLSDRGGCFWNSASSCSLDSRDAAGHMDLVCTDVCTVLDCCRDEPGCCPPQTLARYRSGGGLVLSHRS